MKGRNLAHPMVLFVVVFALLAVLLVSPAVLAQTAQTVKLKMADGFPPTHYVAINVTHPWMDRVVALSKTKVEFQYFPSEQLGKVNDMLNLLKTGVADITYTSPSTLSGEFPLHSFFGLPSLFENSIEGTNVYRQLLKEGPLHDEFAKKGARPLIAWALPNYELFTNKKAVLNPLDAKGLKIRSSGGAMDSVAKALGAVPVDLKAPDMYVALQRGTVDGVITPFTSAQSYKLDDVCKFGTLGANLSSSVPAFSIMEDRWQKLPADVRDAMTKATEEAAARVGKFQDDQSAQIAADYEKKGMKINRMSKEDKARWVQALAPLFDQWIKDMEAKSLPGKQVLDAYKKAAGR